MNLIADLVQATGLKAEQAERAVGTVIAAIQTSTPRELFAKIERAVPKASELVQKSAPPLGGRTGEMRAYVAALKTAAGADRLAAQLDLQGLSPEQIRRTVETLLRHLQDLQGIEPAEALLRELPGLQRLLEAREGTS